MYIPSDETMLQLGLYDYVWGDNTMLQNYLNRIEQEKNREAQREYNKYLKEYDRNKALKDEFRDDKVEYAKLQKERATADPRTRVVIDTQMKNIEDKYKTTDFASQFSSANTKAMDEATESAAKRESQRSTLKMSVKAMLDKAKTPDEKLKIINDARNLNTLYGLINAYNEAGFENPWTEEDLAELAKYAEGVETTQDALHNNAQNNIIADVNEEREKRKKLKELAEKAKKKLESGRKLFYDEQEAYDKIYGGKK